MALAAILDFILRATNVSAQKIDNLLLKIYKMITTMFVIINELE